MLQECLMMTLVSHDVLIHVLVWMSMLIGHASRSILSKIHVIEWCPLLKIVY